MSENLREQVRKLDAQLWDAEQLKTPLTDDEYADLMQFFETHHPPIHAELVSIEAKGLRPQLPALHRLYYREMIAFRAGEPTRYLEFLP